MIERTLHLATFYAGRGNLANAKELLKKVKKGLPTPAHNSTREYRVLQLHTSLVRLQLLVEEGGGKDDGDEDGKDDSVYIDKIKELMGRVMEMQQDDAYKSRDRVVRLVYR